MAVSKKQPDNRIQDALDAGHRLFGENRVQEATMRWSERRASYPDLELHLIGPLQSNKARDAVALFDCIQSVDREKIARALAQQMAAQGRNLPCYIQVNTGDENQKSGISPAELPAFLRLCKDILKLNIVGLMCIPPVGDESWPHFALLAKLAKRHDLAKLSMGMSNDYEIATQFGSTCVRIGTGVFGTRPS